MNPVIYTIGSLIIQALTKEMSEKISHWFQDQEVTRYNDHGFLAQKKAPAFESINPEKQIIWAVKIPEKTESVDFATNQKIQHHPFPGYVHIGNIMLDIDWIHRKAEFSCIFGEKEYWGKGYATKAIRELFIHGFRKLNLHRIWLGTANPAMKVVAKKLGMQQEGLLSDDAFIDGQYVNVFRYGLLSKDFIPIIDEE